MDTKTLCMIHLLQHVETVSLLASTFCRMEPTVEEFHTGMQLVKAAMDELCEFVAKNLPQHTVAPEVSPEAN